MGLPLKMKTDNQTKKKMAHIILPTVSVFVGGNRINMSLFYFEEDFL